MVDVVVFMCILLVVVLSYGVAVQVLLFPFQEPSWDLLIKVLEVPYWQIHGEIFLGHLSGICLTLHDVVFVRRGSCLWF